MRKSLAIPLLILLAVMVAFPIATLVFRSFTFEGQLQSGLAATSLISSESRISILNSLKLGFWVVIVSTLLAYPLAHLLSKTAFARHTWLSIVFLIPFMTPPYIASMGWILFTQKRGLLSQMIPALQGVEQYFFTFGGIVLVMSLHSFPFMLNFLKNAMMNISPNLDEAGAILGASRAYRTRRLTLPLLTSGYAIGALLVFVKTLSEYGTPATLGLRIGMEFFTTQIHRKASFMPVDFGGAARLSTILVGICITFWFLQNTISNHTSYATLGQKGSRNQLSKNSLRVSISGWTYIILLLIVSIGIPYFSIIMTSLIKIRGYGLRAGNYSLQAYQKLFSIETEGLRALWNSFYLSAIAATLAAILGTSIALTTHNKKGNSYKTIQALGLLPEMLPNIVLVIGMMIFWNLISRWIPLYNTQGMLILAYLVMFLPYTIQYVGGILTQMNNHLIQAGRVFGATDFYVKRKILLPLVFRGTLAGWMMTFIICFRELVASSLVLPVGYVTVSTYILREFEQGSVSLGMSMAVICVLCTTLVLLVLNQYTKKVSL